MTQTITARIDRRIIAAVDVPPVVAGTPYVLAVTAEADEWTADAVAVLIASDGTSEECALTRTVSSGTAAYQTGSTVPDAPDAPWTELGLYIPDSDVCTSNRLRLPVLPSILSRGGTEAQMSVPTAGPGPVGSDVRVRVGAGGSVQILSGWSTGACGSDFEVWTTRDSASISYRLRLYDSGGTLLETVTPTMIPSQVGGDYGAKFKLALPSSPQELRAVFTSTSGSEVAAQALRIWAVEAEES